MNKQETERFLADLCPLVFCKYCDINIPRQEIGRHYRLQSHIQNLERCRTEGTYEDLLSYHELYITAKEYIWQKNLKEKDYTDVLGFSGETQQFFGGDEQ